MNKVNDQTAASQEKIKQNTASETTTPKLRKFTAQGEYEKVKASVGLEPPPEPGSKKKLPVEGAVVEDDDNPFQGSIKMIALGRTDGTVVSWWWSSVSLLDQSLFLLWWAARSVFAILRLVVQLSWTNCPTLVLSSLT